MKAKIEASVFGNAKLASLFKCQTNPCGREESLFKHISGNAKDKHLSCEIMPLVSQGQPKHWKPLLTPVQLHVHYWYQDWEVQCLTIWQLTSQFLDRPKSVSSCRHPHTFPTVIQNLLNWGQDLALNISVYFLLYSLFFFSTISL